MSKKIVVQNVNQAPRAGKQQNKNKKKPQRKQKRKRNVQRSGNYLTPCLVDYARALMDPFGAQQAISQSVCIPDEIDIPSFKLSTKGRFTVTVGTNGFGFVMISPRALGSDSIMGYHSTNSFAGLTMDKSAAGVNQLFDVQYPYTAATGRPARIVACGVRVRYTGTELNRGGQVMPAVAWALDDNLDGLSVANILSRPAVKTLSCNRAWHGCFWNQPFAVAYDYSATARPASDGNNIRMAIAVTGVSGNTYECEFIRYFEIIPSIGLTVPTQSASHTDTPGMSVLKDYAGKMASSELGQKVYNGFIEYATKTATAGVASVFNSPRYNTIAWRS